MGALWRSLFWQPSPVHSYAQRRPRKIGTYTPIPIKLGTFSIWTSLNVPAISAMPGMQVSTRISSTICNCHALSLIVTKAKPSPWANFDIETAKSTVSRLENLHGFILRPIQSVAKWSLRFAIHEVETLITSLISNPLWNQFRTFRKRFVTTHNKSSNTQKKTALAWELVRFCIWCPMTHTRTKQVTHWFKKERTAKFWQNFVIPREFHESRLIQTPSQNIFLTVAN